MHDNLERDGCEYVLVVELSDAYVHNRLFGLVPRVLGIC